MIEQISGKPNRLIYEKSPYLLQHAHNPVDWYPWGEEAFEKAHREDKPIFLSIGYSTCHWCHVMEHESFEHPEVARLMNEVFVSIKVDREERPDIDGIYMRVCQMMTGSGGWPLTILMTPDKGPFFAGTYFPRETRYGRAGMLDLIPQIDNYWKTRREEANQAAEEISLVLKEQSQDTTGKQLDARTLQLAHLQLKGRYDERQGGFSSAPKFPTPHNLLFLLRFYHRTGDRESLAMVEKTLQSMRQGGIFDHLGFGFHRYSTDSKWLIPHFEKMLYDQALLGMAYTEAYQATRNEEYRQTAEEIFSYLLRDMTSPEGGFYSAEDADSEGVEGKFYLWTEEEIRNLLGKEADLFIELWGIQPSGNYHDEASGHQTEGNILHYPKPLKEVAEKHGLSQEELKNRLEQVREKLFAVRGKRVHPYKDDKILTDWNGLMIAAFAKGAQVFDRPQYREAAQKAADFILKKLRNPEGRLLHRYREGEAGLEAHLDDYAFFIWGLIELYESTFETKYLRTALDLNQVLIEHFWDQEQGGFYFTADDGEPLLARLKEIYDGAIPSGNSVAALNLLRLGRMTGNPDFEKKAETLGKVFSKKVNSAPSAHTLFMSALEFGVGPTYEIVITGKKEAEDTQKLLKTLQEIYLPNKIVLFRPDGDSANEILTLAPFLKNHSLVEGKATAYVCQNYACEQPITDPAKLRKLLKKKFLKQN